MAHVRAVKLAHEPYSETATYRDADPDAQPKPIGNNNVLGLAQFILRGHGTAKRG